MRQNTETPSYSALAPIYDKIMAHVDYKKWANYIHAIIAEHKLDAQTIFDVSCGTGTCSAHLEKKGYSIFPADLSLPMLKHAQKKYKKRSFGTRLCCASMLHPPYQFKVDLVISLYDSMNYLLEEKQWLCVFDQTYEFLKAGGVFVFDISTLYNSMHDFSDFSQRETFKDAQYKRTSSFDTRRKLQKNYFEIVFKNEKKRVYKETHVQRIRSIDEALQLIQASPFILQAAYKNFTFEPMTDTCERIHFVLLKPS